MTEDKTQSMATFGIVGIVAVVAVVGLIGLMTDSGSTTVVPAQPAQAMTGSSSAPAQTGSVDTERQLAILQDAMEQCGQDTQCIQEQLSSIEESGNVAGMGIGEGCGPSCRDQLRNGPLFSLF